VRPIEEVWVYDVVPEAAKTYAEEMKGRDWPLAPGRQIPGDIFVADSPAQALRHADVVCTATTSQTPVFADEDLLQGVHISGVGSYTPAMQEIPPQTVARAKVIVDSREASLSEAGDLIIPLERGEITESQIHGEIGEVVSGMIPGRESEEEITFFKSVGLAAQDVAVASLILRRAAEQGLGIEVEL
jgi:ornithine cyclodeaminase